MAVSGTICMGASGRPEGAPEGPWPERLDQVAWAAAPGRSPPAKRNVYQRGEQRGAQRSDRRVSDEGGAWSPRRWGPGQIGQAAMVTVSYRNPLRQRFCAAPGSQCFRRSVLPRAVVDQFQAVVAAGDAKRQVGFAAAANQAVLPF